MGVCWYCYWGWAKKVAEIYEKAVETDDKSMVQVVKDSLEALLAIPENERCIEPEDYDDEHPENYPPTCEVKQPVSGGWLCL